MSFATPAKGPNGIKRCLKELAATASPVEKAEILRRYDSSVLKKVLLYALHPRQVYGIKELKEELGSFESRLPYGDDTPFRQITRIFDDLAARKYTGHQAHRIVNSLKGAHPKWAPVIDLILKKDLRCGVQPKTVNKVFKDLIPEFAVMRAQDYGDYNHKLTGPYVAEVKMDGKRITSFISPAGCLDGFLSRNGLEEKGYAHIKDQLAAMFANTSGWVLDGELMFGMFGSRKEQEAEATYVIFDALTYDEWDGKAPCPSQIERSRRLKQIFANSHLGEGSRHIVRSKFKLLKTQAEVESYYTQVVAKGHEGLMLKPVLGTYEHKRSKWWLKLKPCKDADLEIVGVEEGEGKYVGMLGAIIVNFKGKKVNVGSGFTDKQRKQLWDPRRSSINNGGWLIGYVAEVKYTEVTPDGALRFPRFVRLRDDK